MAGWSDQLHAARADAARIAAELDAVKRAAAEQAARHAAEHARLTAALTSQCEREEQMRQAAHAAGFALDKTLAQHRDERSRIDVDAKTLAATMSAMEEELRAARPLYAHRVQAASAAIAGASGDGGGGGGDTAADDEDGLPQLLRKAGAVDAWPV